MKYLRIALLACVMAGWATSAQAIGIFLTGPSGVSAGDSFDLGFWLDVSDQPLLGGGAIVNYDASLVSFDSFAFDPALLCDATTPLDPCGANTLDPFFSIGPIDDGNGVLDFISFGNFNGLDFAAPVQLATLTFSALADGVADFLLDPNATPGWASGLAPFGGIDPSQIDAQGTSVAIDAVGATEPPMLALLGLGLILVALRARRTWR